MERLEEIGVDGLSALAIDAPDVLDSLFGEVRFGLGVLDLELRYVRVNPALAEMHGAEVGEHAGTPMADLTGSADAVDAAAHVARSGEPVRDLRVDGPFGRSAGERTFSASYLPLRVDDEVQGVWVIVREVTALLEARAGEERVLAELAQERAILREVFARAPDGMLLLWGPELRIRATNAWAEAELPERGPLEGRAVHEVYPEFAELAREIPERVLARGETVRFDDLAVPFGGEGALDGNRHYSFSAVPVGDEPGGASGVLVVGRQTTDEVRRRRALERELADEHRIATQLQVSLMPDRLPSIPGVDVASAFHPAGEGHEIGGDFFDVFQLSPESWMVVIGDVCGKGAEAASLTALARYTLRAAAIQEGAEPRALLGQLNEAILRQRRDFRFVTAACAFLEPIAHGALSVRLSVAGHPPPLRIDAGGRVERLTSRGSLLGVWDAPRLEESVLELVPGERLVLWTDGVTEAGAPDDQLTEEALAEVLSGLSRATAAETVAAIEGAVLAAAGSRARDDVAMLVLRADP